MSSTVIPEKVIVFDPATKDREFYIRVETNSTVEFVELNVSTLPLAVAKANELGHDPRHWCIIGNDGKSSAITDIPKSVLI